MPPPKEEPKNTAVTSTWSQSRIRTFKLSHKWTIDNVDTLRKALEEDQNRPPKESFIDSPPLSNDKLKIFLRVNWERNRRKSSLNSARKLRPFVEVHVEALKEIHLNVRYQICLLDETDNKLFLNRDNAYYVEDTLSYRQFGEQDEEHTWSSTPRLVLKSDCLDLDSIQFNRPQFLANDQLVVFFKMLYVAEETVADGNFGVADLKRGSRGSIGKKF